MTQPKVGDVFRITAHPPIIIIGVVREVNENYVDCWEIHLGTGGRLLSFEMNGRYVDGKYGSAPMEWLEPRGIDVAAPVLGTCEGRKIPHERRPASHVNPCVNFVPIPVPGGPMAALVEAIAGERLERLAAGEVL
jgi:hypothetical protein